MGAGGGRRYVTGEWTTGEEAKRMAREAMLKPKVEKPPLDDLLYEAWGVIANVSEGDWTKQPQEWQDAARRWRDRWHEHLEGGNET